MYMDAWLFGSKKNQKTSLSLLLAGIIVTYDLALLCRSFVWYQDCIPSEVGQGWEPWPMWAVCVPENSENSGRDLLPNNIPILVLQYAIKVLVLRHVLCRILSLKEWSWVTFTFFYSFHTFSTHFIEQSILVCPTGHLALWKLHFWLPRSFFLMQLIRICRIYLSK